MRCCVLDGYPVEKVKFKEIFKLFSEPRNLLFAKRFLSDKEIENIIFMCEEFCKKYPVLFPDKNIKAKMHFYSLDVPNFIKTHKTLGLLSEEEGESLHAAFNMENRQLYSVRNGGHRMFLGLKRHTLRSKCDKDLLSPPKRLCKCSDHGRSAQKRTFLVNGSCENCSMD